MPRRRSLLALPLLLAAPALAQPARPDRPLRLVVPFAPGGNADTIARLVGPRLQDALNQSVVVENRPGGGGAIAAAAVAQSAPDGTTLFFDSFNFVVTPILGRNLPLDYERQLVPVANVATAPYVFAVRRGFPATTLPALVEHVRRNPGLPFGTPGTGTVGHLAGALLGARAGIRLEHAPYRGGADVARDLAGGTLDLACITSSSLRPVAEDGRAVPLAQTGAERRATMPNLPTVAEQGFPGFALDSWNGLFAPAGTPAPVIARIEAALAAVLAEAELARRFAPTGTEISFEGTAAFTTRIAQDRVTVRAIVAETGLRLD